MFNIDLVNRPLSRVQLVMHSIVRITNLHYAHMHIEKHQHPLAKAAHVYVYQPP